MPTPIATQLELITPESEVKLPPQKPKPGDFNFGGVNRIVAFGLQHASDRVGHALV